MITLLTTLVSFLAGGLPKILDFFQDRQDKKHELNLAQMQFERELALAAQGFANQARIEEIRTLLMQVRAQTAFGLVLVRAFCPGDPESIPAVSANQR